MLLAPRGGQAYLALALAKPRLIRIRGLVTTMMTGHPMFVFRAAAIFGQDWPTAGVTQRMGPFFQPMSHGHAAIKHETLTVPGAVFLRNLF